METSSRQIQTCIGFAIAILFSNFADADGAVTTEFAASYQPSQREVCEMYASVQSWETVSIDFPECSSVNRYEPIKTLKLSDKSRELKLTKDVQESWPVNQTSLEVRDAKIIITTNNTERLEITSFYKTEYETESISIGHIGNVIVLELSESLGGAHTQRRQVILTPYFCSGFEGYGDETYYSVNQIFVWSLAFANEVYEKTFFSAPMCN